MSGTNKKLSFKTFRNTSTYFKKVKRECTKKKTNINNLDQPTQDNIESNNEVRKDVATVNELNHNFVEMNNIPDEISKEVEELEEKSSLVDDLRNWALSHQIKHCAVSALLKLLKLHNINDLPSDSRTLLDTPTTTNIAPMANGFY